jgi:glycosyltransferase involved in cell wall biosynthesis
LRIGIDATGLPAAITGAGRYTCDLIRALAQLDRRNEYFIFLKAQTANLFGELSAPANFHFVNLPNLSRPLRLLWQHYGAGFHAQHHGLDIWHGLYYTLPGFVRSIRTVATFHDMGFFLHPQFYPWGKRLYFQHAIRQALGMADAILAVSQFTAAEVCRVFNGGAGSNRFGFGKLHTVYSGVDAKFFSRVPDERIQEVRRRYAMASPYIFFLGTYEKRKNQSLLLQAFGRLRALGCRDLLLVLAGLPYNGRAEIDETIARENLSDSVRCLNYVPETDVPALYQGAELFVFPSLYEGFGFPLLEAMAGGVPVLAADNSAMRELVPDAEMLCAGNAQAWAEKMARLLLDHSLRQKLVAKGRRHAQEFSWDRTARETLAIYESVQSAHRRLIPAISLPGLERHPAAMPAPSNGAADGPFPLWPRENRNGAALYEAVVQTLVYADLFDYPLREEEVYEGLFFCRATVAEVRRALQVWQNRGVIARHGRHFCLRGREKNVELRQRRRQHSRKLLKKHAWLLRLIAGFPFVRSVVLSGANAFENCKRAGDDDIDLFIITAGRRLWTVQLGLALLLNLLGKRRTLCMNCLLDLDHPIIDDRDFFVAHQIAFLRPLSGLTHFKKFQSANLWIYDYLPQTRRNHGASAEVFPSITANQRAENPRLKRFTEKILSWRIFDYVESCIFRLYGRRIRRLTKHLKPGSVVVQPGQIKLFTNDHRQRLKNALQQRLQEILALQFSPAEAEENHVVF